MRNIEIENLAVENGRFGTLKLLKSTISPTLFREFFDIENGIAGKFGQMYSFLKD